MSKDTTNLTLAVKDSGSSHHVVKQYGMRYPNGTVRWNSDKISSADYEMFFQHIANDTASRSHWEERLRQRANAAKVDPEQYALGHTALTRDVIVVITEAEEA